MTSLLLERVDWQELAAGLDERGWYQVQGVLSAAECAELTELYVDDDRFRATIALERHRFGKGEYRYFKYPLPRVVARLRQAFYAGLAPVANRWVERLGGEMRYPAALADYLEQCHADGQVRATPLLLRYEAGGYNRLHQDLYGPRSFPLQVVLPLSAVGRDYDGGELVLAEQRPRMQARVTVVAPEQGDAIIFPNAARPVSGSRGDVTVQTRHGASTITRGRRYALGLIFHDAT
jgi:hypothetical protein